LVLTNDLKKYLFRVKYIVLLSLLGFLLSCNNSSDTKIKDDFKKSKAEIEKEFSNEMSKKGNEEISIDQLEKDLIEKDQNLESLMQEMEDEMENTDNLEPDSL
jgi:signal recognition particle GTPase